MRRYCGQSGFSLMEVLVALAVVLILIGALVGAGSYVKTRANVDMTRGLIETLSTALEEYYGNQVPNAFPFDTPDTNGNGILGDDYFGADLLGDLSGTAIIGILPGHQAANPIPPPDTIVVSSASSAALFYFLDRNPASRVVASAVPNALITNKDDGGTAIKIDIGGTEYDLPRYIDPWEMSIRYVYLPGTAFPVLTSAGPDKVFDTPDDITSQ